MANMMARVTIWVIVTSCILVWMLDSYHTCVPARAIAYFFLPSGVHVQLSETEKQVYYKKMRKQFELVKELMILYKLKTISAHGSEQKTKS